MASFELIGIPSYDGIFRNIILNLLLSDNHHCFTSPSSSPSFIELFITNRTKSKIRLMPLHDPESSKQSRSSSGSESKNVSGDHLMTYWLCKKRFQCCEPDSTVIVQWWRSVHHWPFLERIEDLEQQCSVAHRYWHLPPIWHPGC